MQASADEPLVLGDPAVGAAATSEMASATSAPAATEVDPVVQAAWDSAWTSNLVLLHTKVHTNPP